jgi:hypothetical protein
MSPRISARFAWSVCGLTLVMITCTLALFVLNRYGIRDVPYFLVAEATAALVGGLISSRQPRNPVGWFILGHALCFSLGEFSRQYAIYGLRTDPGSLPFAVAMSSPPYWIWLPGIILMFSFVPLYFPDGRLLSPRWRAVAWLAAIVAVIETGFAAIRPGSDEGIPNPLGIESLEGSPAFDLVFEAIAAPLWLAVGALSVASLVVRYRHSHDQERQQIKWVAYAAVFLVTYTLADQVLLQDDISFIADVVLFLIVFEGLWVAVAVAILRYRLYDVDVVINRTLVYGSLTVSLALVYLGSVVVLQAIFRALIGQESQLAVVASTLAIAALFNPLRRRIQQFIDRRFYRGRYDAAKTLDNFSARLRDETDLGTLSEDLLGVVRQTMQPAGASLWLRPTPKGVDPGERRLERVGSVQIVAGRQKQAVADIQSSDVRDAGG